MNEIEKIKRSLFSKEKRVTDIDKFLVQAHHRFMKHYGWIGIDEFAKLPIPTFLNLASEISKEEKKEAESMGRLGRKGKR